MFPSSSQQMINEKLKNHSTEQKSELQILHPAEVTTLLHKLDKASTNISTNLNTCNAIIKTLKAKINYEIDNLKTHAMPITDNLIRCWGLFLNGNYVNQHRTNYEELMFQINNKVDKVLILENIDPEQSILKKWMLALANVLQFKECKKQFTDYEQQQEMKYQKELKDHLEIMDARKTLNIALINGTQTVVSIQRLRELYPKENTPDLISRFKKRGVFIFDASDDSEKKAALDQHSSDTVLRETLNKAYQA